MAKDFIQKAIKKPGALRKSLGIKKGEKIPASKLKAAAKRKFKVYPSAYANIWASKYCKGKVGRTKKADGGFIARGCGKVMNNRRKKTKMV